MQPVHISGFKFRTWRGALNTTSSDTVCQWQVWFSPFIPVSPTNKTDRHDITDLPLNSSILLKVDYKSQDNVLASSQYFSFDMVYHEDICIIEIFS